MHDKDDCQLQDCQTYTLNFSHYFLQTFSKNFRRIAAEAMVLRVFLCLQGYVWAKKKNLQHISCTTGYNGRIHHAVIVII